MRAGSFGDCLSQVFRLAAMRLAVLVWFKQSSAFSIEAGACRPPGSWPTGELSVTWESRRRRLILRVDGTALEIRPWWDASTA